MRKHSSTLRRGAVPERPRSGESFMGRIARTALAAALALAMAPAPARADALADDGAPCAGVETAAAEPTPAPGAIENEAPPSTAHDDEVPGADAAEEAPEAEPDGGRPREAKALSISLEAEEGAPASTVTAFLRAGSPDAEDAYAETVEAGDPVGAEFGHVAEGAYFVGVRFADRADAERYELGATYALTADGTTSRHNKGDPIAVADGQEIAVVLTLAAKAAGSGEAEGTSASEAEAAPPVRAPGPPAARGAAEPDYSGRCYVRCANPGTGWDDGSIFDVTMPDGQVIRGHCIDPGLSYPSDGEYGFTGYWNGSSYDVVAWTQDAVPGGLLGSPCQRVGNFQWLPHGYHDPGTVQIIKVDSATGSRVPQNGLTFAGAQFVLRNVGTGQTWTMTVNQNSIASINQIPLGDYTLVETVAPVGYDLDPTVHSFSIGTPNSGQNQVTITARDAVQKGEIAIQKSTVGGTSNLAGIKFDVVNAATDRVAATIALDGAGRGSTGKVLPYGHYRIVEDAASVPADLMAAGLSGHAGDVVVSDAFVSGKGTYAFDVKNYKKPAASVKKTSHDGQDLVANTEFTLYRLDGAAWTELGKATTDETGTASFAENIIDRFGTFKIEETKNNSDYMTDTDSDKVNEEVFTVDAAAYKPVYSFSFANYEKIDIELVKVDGDAAYAADPDLLADPSAIDPADIVRVGGAEFTLYRLDGAAWTELGKATTDETGTAKFADNIIDRFGTFKIEETLPADVDSPDGYMWPTQSRQATSTEFTVDAETYAKIAAGAHESNDDMGYTWQLDATGSPQLELTAINWKYRDIEVRKTDQETGEAIANTEYDLYRYIGEGVPGELSDQETRGSHATTSIDPKNPVDTSKWEYVETLKTGGNGTLLFRGLVFGYYMTLETTPNPDYAYWYESGNSSWDRYFFAVDEKQQKQTQVYENMKITLETNVHKSTIARTTAAFTSPYDKDWNNVKIEGYRYDVGFDNGGTNVRADQYTVEDACEFVSLGLRIDTLWTPIVANDTDGTYNIKYRTNFSDGSSEASATAGNPANKLADGTDRIDAASWHDWSVEVPCNSRVRLDVADLHLAEGEYITALLLEFGSVETGFSSSTPMSYTVHAEYALPYNDDATVIPNSATSHITRNWFDGDGLKDDSSDDVETRVIGTFECPAKRAGSFAGSRGSLSGTGDRIPTCLVPIAAIAGAAAMAAGTLGLARRGKRR